MPRGETRDLNDRITAAYAWIVTGSCEKASKLCGIPARTIRDWTNTDWWVDLIQEARKHKQQELDAQLTGIIHAAGEELMDRILNGDEVMKKDGTVARRKVPAGTLGIILATQVDKRAIIRGEPTSIRGEKKTIKEQLENVAKELQELGSIHDELH